MGVDLFSASGKKDAFGTLCSQKSERTGEVTECLIPDRHLDKSSDSRECLQPQLLSILKVISLMSYLNEMISVGGNLCV